MRLHLYQVDAFASRTFEGNPAAVCPLESWLDDTMLQSIAAENNLSETAFVVREGDGYQLRWFTPAVEVDLCGHATLATAWVLANVLCDNADVFRFQTRSGELRVRSLEGGAMEMDFPARPPRPCDTPNELLAGLGLEHAEVLESDDYIVVVPDERTVADLHPDFELLRGLPNRGVAVTAPGRRFDFVSRWFGPNVGVNEDPVTGSAHTALAPFWAKRIDRAHLTAQQGGARIGQIECKVQGDRVLLIGRVAPYLEGVLTIGST